MSPESVRPLKLRFAVEFDEKPDRDVPMIAYAFDRTGRLLDKAPVREGQAELTMPPAAASGARIFFAPTARADEQQEVTLADIERLHAYQPQWRFDPKQAVYKLAPIPKKYWEWWLLCRCRVPGRVVKHVMIGGEPIDRPVCGARVHICEVDKFWWILRRLPDYHVFKLRDDLLELLRRPPLPDPPEREVELPFPPRPDPVAMIHFAGMAASEGLTWINPQPEPPLPLRKLAATLPLQETLRAAAMLGPQPEPPGQPSAAVELAPEVRLALTSKSPSIVREALIKHDYLILPILCYFPWLLPFLTCDEVAVVDSSSDGRFDAEIWYRCAGDKPDLYFWVEYFLDGSWQTVYKPNRRCRTWWNYPCGTEVTIHITDPRVPICDYPADLPGLQVVIAAIGNQVSFKEIIQPGAAWAFAGDTGMTHSPDTDIASYLPATLKPFAGSLELRLDMSRSNLIAAGVTHYRWCYRRVRNADLTVATDTWHPMTRDVFRHYKVQIPDPTVLGGFRPAYPTDKLGMDPAYPGDYLTRIQPALTPAGDYEWVPLNEHVDMAWAYFDTADLVEPGTEGSVPPVPTAGKYELKLELFNVGSGTPALVNWSHPTGPGSAGINVFVANNDAPFGPPTGMSTAPAVAEHLLKDPAGDTVGFRMVVHVDNVHCSAAIDDVVVLTPGSPAEHGGPCGFFRFPDRINSQVLIAFTAHQPSSHADFYFRVDKGSAGPVGEACADWLAAPIPADPDNGGVRWTWTGAGVNGFGRAAASHFTKLVAVQTLLDSHGTCPEAAFAETIYVAARATDGYQRAYWLDASATPKAFALAPTT